MPNDHDPYQSGRNPVIFAQVAGDGNGNTNYSLHRGIDPLGDPETPPSIPKLDPIICTTSDNPPFVVQINPLFQWTSEQDLTTQENNNLDIAIFEYMRTHYKDIIKNYSRADLVVLNKDNQEQLNNETIQEIKHKLAGKIGQDFAEIVKNANIPAEKADGITLKTIGIQNDMEVRPLVTSTPIASLPTPGSSIV